MKILILVPMLVVIGSLLVGCQTKATSQRFITEGNNTQICRNKILDARVKIEEARAKQPVKTQVIFKDERNALTYMIVEKMADQTLAMLDSKRIDELGGCDDIIVAMIQADQAKTQGLIRGGTSLGSVALGLIGLDILTDGLGRGSSTTGDTFNVNGSRFVSKSGNQAGNASASGTGLGLGNVTTVGAGQGVGGIEPRTTPINGDVSTFETGSNSGTNEPARPIEGNDPTILPVE